jgi:hypothetical protein
MDGYRLHPVADWCCCPPGRVNVEPRPAMQRVKSSATAPAPYFLQLALDAANLESAQPWQALRQLVEHRPGKTSPSRSVEL